MRGILAPLGGRVEWVGFKPWEELAAVYASAQLLCVPSRHDGWGLVVAEGLAAGLPVISTDRTGAAIDLVRPGTNGWILRAGDGAALAVAMREAAALDASARRAMSAAARASVAHHTLDDGAERFLAAVDCAIEVTAAAGRS
jgi:glycosyltransferase involved in cell wall biosynthesis